MDEQEVIPFWGPEQLELFELMTQAIDPEERVPAAMQAAAPLEGRKLLDIGAGVGDRTIVYARLAGHVYALEPDPRALPILRGRIKSAVETNVTVVPGSAESIPLEDGTVDVAYATWAYFFGPGSEAGLREVERVVRPGGDIVVVQNYGRDELSEFWLPQESECETWPPGSRTRALPARSWILSGALVPSTRHWPCSSSCGVKGPKTISWSRTRSSLATRWRSITGGWSEHHAPA